MPKQFSDFIEDNKAEKFEEMTEGVSEQKKRKIEKSFFRPNKLQPYTGKKPKPNLGLAGQTVKIVFGSVSALDRFKKFFTVNKYIEPSTHDIGLLHALFDKLESGELIYDKEKSQLIIPDGHGQADNSGSSTLGEGE